MSSYFFLELFAEPFVFTTPVQWSFFDSLAHCRRRAGGRPFFLIMSASWNVAALRDEYAHTWAKARHLCPEATLLWLVPGRSDAELLTGLGMEALHCHHNAFLDETIFRPDTRAPKRYSAALNSNSAGWKRHELAWGVKRLALITYILRPEDDLKGLQGFKDLAFTNFDSTTRTAPFLAPEEVASVLNQSQCGLMLSAQEGANFASAEYMFCGIPLVTTPSMGGRHGFYDSRYVQVVAPTAAAVEAGVTQCIDWPVDPEEIHAATLERAIRHRRRLLDRLSRMIERDAHALANANAWLPSFRDKLRVYHEVGSEEVLQTTEH